MPTCPLLNVALSTSLRQPNSYSPIFHNKQKWVSFRPWVGKL